MGALPPPGTAPNSGFNWLGIVSKSTSSTLICVSLGVWLLGLKESAISAELTILDIPNVSDKLFVSLPNNTGSNNFLYKPEASTLSISLAYFFCKASTFLESISSFL